MKKSSLFLAAICLFLLMAGSAFATTIFSPTLSEISGFTLTGASDPTTSSLDSTFIGLDSVLFGGTVNLWGSNVVSNIMLGKTFAATDYTGFGSYGLSLENNNGNPWDFRLYIEVDGNKNFGGTQTIVNGSSAGLLMDISAFDLTKVTGFGLVVEGLVPRPDGIVGPNLWYDYQFSVAVAPVPEPGTLVLLGSGLIGLAYLKRRKKA